MYEDELEMLLKLHRAQGGQEKAIIARIAKDAYEHPRVYGFDSEEDVGEVFCEYWNRIVAIIEHYKPCGQSFCAYVVASFRYFAMAVKHRNAANWDRECAVFEEERHQNRDYQGETAVDADGLMPQVLTPGPTPLSRDAERKRIAYLCVKLAHRLDDDFLERLAKATGIERAELMRHVEAARRLPVCQNRHYRAHLHGRDAAWLRLRVYERRLWRNPEPGFRAYLAPKIDRDRRLYLSAVDGLRHSRSALTNTEVARILGVSKSTVDSGLNRFLRNCGMVPKMARSGVQFRQLGGNHGYSGGDQQRPQARGIAGGRTRPLLVRSGGQGPVV